MLVITMMLHLRLKNQIILKETKVQLKLNNWKVKILQEVEVELQIYNSKLQLNNNHCKNKIKIHNSNNN
jgi:hypothetical protein